jgi:hypothetical protein
VLLALILNLKLSAKSTALDVQQTDKVNIYRPFSKAGWMPLSQALYVLEGGEEFKGKYNRLPISENLTSP